MVQHGGRRLQQSVWVVTLDWPGAAVGQELQRFIWAGDRLEVWQGTKVYEANPMVPDLAKQEALALLARGEGDLSVLNDRGADGFSRLADYLGLPRR